MPAPASITWEGSALDAAHTAILGEIDAGSGAGIIKLYADDDTLLCEITLDDPAGTVNATTGQLTITAPSAGTAVATGTCTYGTITDSDNNVIVTAPAEAGTSAVSDKIVINTLGITSGASITLNSCTIG